MRRHQSASKKTRNQRKIRGWCWPGCNLRSTPSFLIYKFLIAPWRYTWQLMWRSLNECFRQVTHDRTYESIVGLCNVVIKKHTYHGYITSIYITYGVYNLCGLTQNIHTYVQGVRYLLCVVWINCSRGRTRVARWHSFYGTYLQSGSKSSLQRHTFMYMREWHAT